MIIDICEGMWVCERRTRLEKGAYERMKVYGSEQDAYIECFHHIHFKVWGGTGRSNRIFDAYKTGSEVRRWSHSFGSDAKRATAEDVSGSASESESTIVHQCDMMCKQGGSETAFRSRITLGCGEM